MKKKFWLGFAMGVCLHALGCIGLMDCKDKEEKLTYLSGWLTGMLILTGFFIVISLLILGV